MTSFVVDPFKITNYERSDAELEAFALFAVLVAGKTAKVQAAKLERFLAPVPPNVSPFEYVAFLNEKRRLRRMAIHHGLGQYARIIPAFLGLTRIPSLRSASLSDLENVHGVGPKTARFFLLHSRRDVRVAVLDTHTSSRGFASRESMPRARRPRGNATRYSKRSS